MLYNICHRRQAVRPYKHKKDGRGANLGATKDIRYEVHIQNYIEGVALYASWVIQKDC